MRPLISIVVPVYNAGPHLEPCLDSLLKQTYRPIEIILVDDHSTDGSSEVCARWAADHSMARVIPGTNQGANGGRSLGVQAAKGDFVLCSDADDLAHPQLLEILFGAICQTGLPCAACRYRWACASSSAVARPMPRLAPLIRAIAIPSLQKIKAPQRL